MNSGTFNNLIKTPAVAGMFYPADPERLSDMITGFLKQAKGPRKGTKKIKAAIVPHAGYEYSGPVAAAAYQAIKGAVYDKILVLGLSHQVWFNGIAGCDYEGWETPLGKVALQEWQENKQNGMIHFNKAFAEEHSVEVQLPFLQKVISKLLVLPLLTGDIVDINSAAIELEKLLSVEDLFLVSSDLSHYHEYSEAREIDMATVSKILELEPKVEHEEACGADGVNILINIAREKNWQVQLLDYRNSGDTAGSKDQVVGYGAFIFTES